MISSIKNYLLFPRITRPSKPMPATPAPGAPQGAPTLRSEDEKTTEKTAPANWPYIKKALTELKAGLGYVEEEKLRLIDTILARVERAVR